MDKIPKPDLDEINAEVQELPWQYPCIECGLLADECMCPTMGWEGREAIKDFPE